MEQIQLIALDMDGTLLDSEKRLSPANAQALSRCAQMGIQIVPATGRAASGIIPQVRDLPGVNYAIATNGGAVIELKTGRILDCHRIPNQQAVHLMEMLSAYHVMYDPYVDGRGKMQKSFFEHMDEYRLSPVIQDLIRATRDVVPDVIEYMKTSKKDAEKINVYVADLKDKEILRPILMAQPGLAVSASLVNNLEINSADATKGNALMWLADYLGIPRESTLAFGDGENDISMLFAAGIGVAMENALDIVKSAADCVTRTNDQDGVARFLEDRILRQKETNKNGLE